MFEWIGARVPGRDHEEWDLSISSLEERVEALASELVSSIDASTSVARAEEKRRGLAGDPPTCGGLAGCDEPPETRLFEETHVSIHLTLTGPAHADAA